MKLKSNFNQYASVAQTWLKKYFRKPPHLAEFSNLHLNIATLFGCGYFKYGSGTFASAVTAIFGLLMIYISHTLLFGIIVAAFIIGVIVSNQLIAGRAEQDPGYIVVDEFVGQLIPFVLIGSHSFLANLFWALLSFIIFRVLDIFKPWLIGRAETFFKGGMAVMMDDVVAGFATLCIVFILHIVT